MGVPWVAWDDLAVPWVPCVADFAAVGCGGYSLFALPP